jgi:hypothetical protein
LKTLLLIVPVCAALAAEKIGERPAIDSERYLAHIKHLSSEQFRGRFTGAPELDNAAKYIAGQFEQIGLKPAGSLNGYLQTFRLTTKSKLGDKNALATRIDGKRESLKSEDFTPLYFSGSAKVAAPVVFAGYGITAPDLDYDDYAGLDVKDKIVIVLRREPQEKDEKSKFNGAAMTSHGSFESKLTNAKIHGAKALIIVNNTAAHPDEAEGLLPFQRMIGPVDNALPYLQVKTTVAARWFKAAGHELDAIQQGIDQDLKPRSFAFPSSFRMELTADVERVIRPTSNVLGYLPGETDEYIVVGAHYDHLGLGEAFTLAPSEVGAIHPGADDNASGTSGVIELARLLAKGPKLKRGVLFMTFTGEELGLLGSGHFVRNPVLPLAKCAAMVNMDMVGRPREGRVIVGGAGTGSTFKALLDQMIPRHPDLKVDQAEPAGFGGSDHTSFAAQQVPILFFFSGLHGDYHRPSDTWDKIEVKGSAALLSMVADTVLTLTSSAERAQFVRVQPAGGAQAAASGGSGASGYGAAYFGSIPDMGAGVKGVKFADLRPGSPAEKAGLKAGDVMVEFDGKPVENLSDYTYLLRQKKPGDVVPVKVERSGEMVEVKVELTARK